VVFKQVFVSLLKSYQQMEIDLREVVRSKSPLAARLMPRPLLNWLKRIVHQDDINHVLRNYSQLPPADFIRATLGSMGVDCAFRGLEWLDPAGRYIFASNHPFGGLDGIMIAEEIIRRLGDVRVVVNDLLMFVEPLAPIFVPVNKHGRQERESARTFHEAFASDAPIVTFPAGLCSRRHKGVVSDLPWQSSFVKMAVKYRRNVVPMYVGGRLSNRFYRLANLRTALGIKANIEMLFLVDEMYRQGGRTFEIVAGEPVAWQELREGIVEARVEEIRTKAYLLGGAGL
jgi:putative hemolysin